MLAQPATHLAESIALKERDRQIDRDRQTDTDRHRQTETDRQ